MLGPRRKASRWHDPGEEPPEILPTSKRKEPEKQVTDKDDQQETRKERRLDVNQDVKSIRLLENPHLRPLLSSAESCRSLDHYEKLQKIGEGTYGSVYKARCRETNEYVALKKLKLENETEGFPQTSIRETITLLKGKHPNVIDIREIVFGNGRLDEIYIVMDFMDRDLRSLMKDMNRPFYLSEFKLLLKQLISAVAHLHENWILHRDLKPSNLLIHKGMLKVGDFGLAREYGSPLTRYTGNVVTLWYRAPELLLQTGKYSTPIDVWSIGCLFGELLTKRATFEGQTVQQQIRLIFEALGSPTGELWPDFEHIKLSQKFDFRLSNYRNNTLLTKLGDRKDLSKQGFHLWNRLLAYDPGVKSRQDFVKKPTHRITAEAALEHEFFEEEPKAIHPSLFPTWPNQQASRSG